MLMAHGTLFQFRATYGWCLAGPDGVTIDVESAAKLRVTVGDVISHVARW
jgi:arginine/ornithine N-succinyltransferase beta subunit